MNLGPRSMLGFWIAVGVGIGVGFALHDGLGRGGWIVGAIVGWVVDIALRWGRGSGDA